MNTQEPEEDERSPILSLSLETGFLTEPGVRLVTSKLQ